MQKSTKVLLILLLTSIFAIGMLLTKIGKIQPISAQDTCQPVGYYCVNGIEFAAFDDVNCAQRQDEETGNQCTVDPLNLCGPQQEGSCTRGSICDCTLNCLLPNILPAGHGCCSDRGNVCQTGLSCIQNVCSDNSQGPSPTNTSTPTPTNPDEPGATDSADQNTPTPGKEYFSPSFTSIVIQSMFFVLTLAIIFSVIR